MALEPVLEPFVVEGEELVSAAERKIWTAMRRRVPLAPKVLKTIGALGAAHTLYKKYSPYFKAFHPSLMQNASTTKRKRKLLGPRSKKPGKGALLEQDGGRAHRQPRRGARRARREYEERYQRDINPRVVPERGERQRQADIRRYMRGRNAAPPNPVYFWPSERFVAYRMRNNKMRAEARYWSDLHRLYSAYRPRAGQPALRMRHRHRPSRREQAMSRFLQKRGRFVKSGARSGLGYVYSTDAFRGF